MEPSAESHYVSFLAAGEEEEEGVGGGIEPTTIGRATLNNNSRESVYQRRLGGSSSFLEGQQQQGTIIMTTRTYFWKKLLRGRRNNKRFLAFLLLAAAVAFTLLMLTLMLSPGQQQQDQQSSLFEEDDASSGSSNDAQRRGDETDADGKKYPEKIWEWKEHHFQSQFFQFQRDHNKVYASEAERQKKYAIFKNNLIYIHNHNMQGYSFTLKMNKFGDLTLDEFRRQYLGYKKTDVRFPRLGVDRELETAAVADDSGLPKAVDWRQRGCVTSVKDQGECGSCWAFSATGAMEGAYCGKTGKLVNLSQQQLVDCSRYLGNQGCNGGTMEDAFEYVIENAGICAADSYPYTKKDGTCQSTKCTPVATIKGYKSVPPLSEIGMQAALALKGPVSIAIQASQAAFQFYHDGVFDAPCGTDLDHGVLLVGYSAEAGGKDDYWIMKNSWGSAWGKAGYMLMAMHKGPAGQCGLLLDGSYPVA